MKDELREKIAKWFIESVNCEDPYFFPSDKARYWSDQILSLLAPILADAEKWRRVKEIADGDYCSRCFNRFKCPSEDYAPCPFSDILNEVEEGIYRAVLEKEGKYN